LGDRADVAKRNPPATDTNPGPTKSGGFDALVSGRKPAAFDLVGGEYALRKRSVHSGQAPTQSRPCETEPAPGLLGRADSILSPLKGELALWRAFLADDIDAILRDKD
jgi:hypothetical protein